VHNAVQQQGGNVSPSPVIFDLGGVLVDNEPVANQVLTDTEKEAVACPRST
jgi:beta-phosphoglucomutase-like phosphatase (HAD superfamily)